MKKPNKNKITFFPGGDKTFIVGADDDKIKARVSTDVLKVASAAFGAMLTSGFKESLEKEVSLTEEDPAVMLDFFNVIHGETKHLEQRDGSHLVKLAVMADMWLCVDALKEWVAKQMEPVAQNLSRDIEFGIILPTPATSGGRKEQSLWEVDKTAKGTYTYTIRSKVLNLVFDIKDIIEIAYVFELDDLLWDASRFALVYSSGPGEFEIPCRVPFPPIGESGDISVHGLFMQDVGIMARLANITQTFLQS